jgi:pSer/pThr/pTyr-binding forkhead associated (FHA) protein
MAMPVNMENRAWTPGWRELEKGMEAKLIPLNGGAPISIKRDVTVVGRKRDLCDIFVDRGSISKLHCVIVKTDGLLFIRDLGSTNGTKVNGQKITRGALLPGDELAFASAKFRVYLGPDEPEGDPAQHTEMLSGHVSPLDQAEPLASDQPFMNVDWDSDSDVRLIEDSDG